MRYISDSSKWLILTGIIMLSSAFSASAADPIVKEQKVAEVNGVTISMKDLNNEYGQLLKQKGTQENTVTTEQALDIKKELLTNLINQELLYQESKKQNIVVENAVVADTIAKVKEKFETEEAFSKAMKDANIQGDDLEVRVERSIAINKFVDEKINQNIIVSDEESKQYYDSHPDSFQETEKIRASHILVKVEKDDSEEKRTAAKEKITGIQGKLKEGEDFAQLARENSDCPSSAQGGDLGYFKRGMMVKEFEDAAFALAPGSVSDIVETQFGYHIIKIADKKEAGTISYDTVKSDLQNFLKRQKLTQAVSSLIESLRKDATIKTYL